MRRRYKRYRTIQVAQLDRQLAESEAIRRALRAGARNAWVTSTEFVSDHAGNSVWEIVMRVTPPRGGWRRPR